MPRSAIHPGEILAEELTELRVTPTELSRQIGVPPNRVTQIIHGRRGVTGDTALRFGHRFGTSARNSGSTCKTPMTSASPSRGRGRK
jgi:antitoxin HigA-1